MNTSTFAKTIVSHWSVIAVVAVLIYYSIFSHEFQLYWDDQWQVINSMTNDGISLKNLQTIFHSISNGQYSPINQLYYTLIHLCFGYSSLAFHIGNLLFHIFNACLVYLLAYSFIRNHFDSKKALGISFFTALLFAIHLKGIRDVRYEGQNPVGFAYPKISAEHVRRIAEPFYYLHDMLPCFFGHILVVVKGSGNRCDRNIGFPRNILNCDDSVHLPVTTIRRNLRLVSKLIYFSVYFTST